LVGLHKLNYNAGHRNKDTGYHHFVAIDLARCSVNVSGQLHVFWRLTGVEYLPGSV